MRGESFRSTGNHLTTSLYETLREEILEAERRVVVQFQKHHRHSKCSFLYLSCLLGTYGQTHKMSPLVNRQHPPKIHRTCSMTLLSWAKRALDPNKNFHHDFDD